MVFVRYLTRAVVNYAIHESPILEQDWDDVEVDNSSSLQCNPRLVILHSHICDALWSQHFLSILHVEVEHNVDHGTFSSCKDNRLTVGIFGAIIAARHTRSMALPDCSNVSFVSYPSKCSPSRCMHSWPNHVTHRGGYVWELAENDSS